MKEAIFVYTKGQRLNDSTYMKYPEQMNPQAECRLVIATRLGRGINGNDHLMGMKAPSK